MQRMLEMFSHAPRRVKEPSERVDAGVMSFMETERCIQDFLNSLSMMK